MGKVRLGDMKLKYYMRGLGIGIVLTTIILSISFNFSSKVQLSDEEIIKRAEELGMISSEKTNPGKILATPSTTPDQKDTVEAIEDKAKEELNAQTSDQTEEETKDEIADDTKENNEDTSSSETSEQPEEVEEIAPQDLAVTVEIKKGMNSEDVASLLKNYGVIEDNKQFNKYLVESGYAKIIIYGVFELPLDASYEQITDIIIR